MATSLLVAGALLLCTAGMVAAASRPTGDPGHSRTSAHEGPLTTSNAEAQDGRDRPPNIIVITTDDQDLASLSPETMPDVTRLLQRRGTTFTDHVVSGPLCCPARAVFLTGQYGHNNGVTWNKPGYAELRDKDSTLPVWLQRSGYRTMHIGMYLNRYSEAADRDTVAPGWHDWHTMLDDRAYYRYTMHVNGRRERYGDRPRDYVTRVFNRKAVRLIRRHAPRQRPLFLSLDQRAPHGGGAGEPRCFGTAAPDPLDRDLFRGAALPRPPSFDEADVSDKPSFVSSRPPLTPEDVRETRRQYGCRLASLRAVDRGVREIHRAVRAEGELGNTVIIFTSDNGWMAGQHRVPEGKVVPYEEAIRVPLIIRAPRRTTDSTASPSTVSQPTANIDLAPTILDLAGARPCVEAGNCRTLDGRSLLGLLRGESASWPEERGILLEMEVPSQRASPFTPCDYEGIRAGGHVYLEHHSATGPAPGDCRPGEETELYSLGDDPHQLVNRSPAPPGSSDAELERRLAARLADLRGCSGVDGRDARPPGTSFCE